MSRTWVLVASSAEAQLLESRSRRSDLHVMAEYRNADGRAHEGDLITDRGAAVVARQSDGQRRYTEPQVSAKEHAIDLFAIELAQVLRHGRINDSYRELMLVAPPQMLGKLRARLDDPTLRCITQEEDKNLCQLPPDALVAKLQEVLVLQTKVP